MEVRFVQRGMELDDKLRSYMAGKMSKMDKFFHKILSSQVVVSHHKGNFNVETTVDANGVILRAEENATEPRRAFDLALKNLERRIKRHNSYLKDKGHYDGGEDFSFSLEGDLEGTDPETEMSIGKAKKVPIHPMDPVEAVMQMELIGHSFFMFQNAKTGDVNVVYKRKKEKDYGLLEPIQ
ncbi:MAG: ribosome-associated translation inhibitor RaiA [Synergistaceae bacterium]|nr:ribosome-associated translation inhibitor RaiA [Synergistaceae bacterium]